MKNRLDLGVNLKIGDVYPLPMLVFSTLKYYAEIQVVIVSRRFPLIGSTSFFQDMDTFIEIVMISLVDPSDLQLVRLILFYYCYK